MSEISPQECYQHLGFHPFAGDGPYLPADDWRRVQNTQNLADIRQRYRLQREFAGAPLVDHGFVVGSVPPLGLSQPEFDKLMAGLEQGLAAGCATVRQWQEHKLSQKWQQP